jgi:hypothetical protein
MDERGRWLQLAALLRHQRVVVLGYRSRAAFARAKGVSDRVLFDLEGAKKSSYSGNTLLSLEAWYELTPGQLEDVLGPLYPRTEIMHQHGSAVIVSTAEEETIEDLRFEVGYITIMLDGVKARLAELESRGNVEEQEDSGTAIGEPHGGSRHQGRRIDPADDVP